MVNIRQALKATAHGEMVHRTPDCGSLQFQPSPDFIGFKGHFPGFPILPAMFQILLGVIVSEELYGHPLTLQRIEKAKFMTQIKPEQTITVFSRLSQKPDQDSNSATKARITITVAGQKAASMTLFLEQR